MQRSEQAKDSRKDICPPQELKRGTFLVVHMVKNSPSSAEDASLTPGQGTKIPQAMGQLRPWATTTEPTCSGDCMLQLRSDTAINKQRLKKKKEGKRHGHISAGTHMKLEVFRLFFIARTLILFFII